MENKEKYLEALWELLHRWVPLSSKFRIALQGSMRLQYVKRKQLLKERDTHLNHAWFSIDCWVAAQHISPHGREEITSIYGPGEIFTDVHSFLKGKPSEDRLMVLGGSTLLEIDRQLFKQLRSYPETGILLEHYLLEKQQKDQWRMDLMLLPDVQKFNAFADRFPIDQLPGKVCASFLRMTPSRYSAAKNFYHNSK